MSLDEDARAWVRFWRESEDIGTIRWFGESWEAPVNDPRTQIPVPVGEHCTICGEQITAGQQGIRIPAISRGAKDLWRFLHRFGWVNLTLGVPAPFSCHADESGIQTVT